MRGWDICLLQVNSICCWNIFILKALNIFEQNRRYFNSLYTFTPLLFWKLYMLICHINFLNRRYRATIFLFTNTRRWRHKVIDHLVRWVLMRLKLIDWEIGSHGHFFSTKELWTQLMLIVARVVCNRDILVITTQAMALNVKKGFSSCSA